MAQFKDWKEAFLVSEAERFIREIKELQAHTGIDTDILDKAIEVLNLIPAKRGF